MTTLFSLKVTLPSSVETASQNQLFEAVGESFAIAESSATEEVTRLPIVCCESFQLSPSVLNDGNNDSPRLAVVFCPTTLIESSYEQLKMQADGSPIEWVENPSILSRVLLSLIHPFLAQNFTIRAIFTKQKQQHTPSDLVLLDLSHTPRAAIADLMDATNCQVVHSGPEAILKVLLLSTVQFTTIEKEKEATEASHQASARMTVDIPTCAVCLHRIDPLRLGLPRPRNHHFCSKFCPPPNLANNSGNAVSCPRQRLLWPWPPPNHCDACHVIRNYWRKDDQADDMDNHLVCSYCGMKETLWVCLTCAVVGCGRYSNKHAAEHNSSTGHPFCLELSTLRIWSYVDGEFAHRLDLLECPSSPPLLQPWVVRGSASATFASILTVESSNHLEISGNTRKYASSASSPYDHRLDDYERMIAANFASVDEKTPKKATMIGEEYEALLQSALEEQAQHYEGEITWLRATLTAQQVDQESMTPDEAAEIDILKKQIAALRTDIDHAARELLDLQAQEAGHRATSQRLLREQRVTQDLLSKVREEAGSEHEEGRVQIEELELQIADLTANQRMMQQFSQNEDLKNSQIFGTEQSPQPSKTKKGKKLRKFFRK
jgi:BRCA1-associated protein